MSAALAAQAAVKDLDDALVAVDRATWSAWSAAISEKRPSLHPRSQTRGQCPVAAAAATNAAFCSVSRSV